MAAKQAQPRDASGRFINRQTWELAYAMAGERVPARVGVRNAKAPLTRQEVERTARKHRKVSLPKAKPATKARTKAPVRRRTVKQPDTAFPRGTEFELTARYKGKGKDNLHIKIRVVLSSAMTADQARHLVDGGMESGRMPPGVRVESLDWSRGKKGSEYEHPGSKILRDFYGAISGADHAATRFERVESDTEYAEWDDADEDAEE